MRKDYNFHNGLQLSDGIKLYNYTWDAIWNTRFKSIERSLIYCSINKVNTEKQTGVPYSTCM